MDDRMAESAAKANAQVDELMRRMNAQAVFGEPIQKGNVTLIPVAAVTYGFGVGQGYGRGPRNKEGQPVGPEAEQGEGAGAGGGGGGMARPLGYIKIDENGAKWEPTMNMTLVSVSGMLLAAWNVFWVMKMIRTVVAAKQKS
ncbi:MAG: spore germination protein GerW family protein [Nitrososphaerales archaeon]